MLDSYQTACLNQCWPFVLMLVLVSLTYAYGDRCKTGLRYLFVVLHPVIFLGAFAFAVLSSPSTGGGMFQPALLVHQLIVSVGFVGTIVAASLFRGYRPLILVTLFSWLAAAGFWILGGMTITHDWI